MNDSSDASHCGEFTDLDLIAADAREVHDRGLVRGGRCRCCRSPNADARDQSRVTADYTKT
jgi:hypothetical protein